MRVHLNEREWYRGVLIGRGTKVLLGTELPSAGNSIHHWYSRAGSSFQLHRESALSMLILGSAAHYAASVFCRRI